MIKYVTVDVQVGSSLWQALHFLHRVGKLKEVLIFNYYVDVSKCESVFECCISFNISKRQDSIP